jgi:hypothetical protein
MPTTTKMAIPYPSSTDLVKDGATNMGSMATQIDAKTGMVLLNTTSFSAVSSQSFNNVFSADYDHYALIFDMKLGSSIANLLFRLRASGTDATGANYFYISNNRSGTSNPVATTSSATSINVALINDTYPNPATIYVYNPFAAQGTGIIGTNTSTYTYTRAAEGYHTLSTSYDGFTLTIDANNITGKVSVYGFNK